MELRAFGINGMVHYKEILYDTPVINKVYLLSNPENIPITAIPDGCIDMQIVDCDHEVQVFLAGSHTQHTNAHIMKYSKVFGVKFQPGIEFDALTKKNFKADELIESRCDITDVCGMEQLKQGFQNNADFSELVDCFLDHNRELGSAERNCIIAYIMREIEKAKGNINITELAEKTGYSQRYVDKVFKEKTGLSLKKYAVIVRLQYAIDVVRDKPAEEIYDMLGYYDQAHFIHDFKNFTSLTPKKYKKLGKNFYFV